MYISARKVKCAQQSADPLTSSCFFLLLVFDTCAVDIQSIRRKFREKKLVVGQLRSIFANFFAPWPRDKDRCVWAIFSALIFYTLGEAVPRHLAKRATSGQGQFFKDLFTRNTTQNLVLPTTVYNVTWIWCGTTQNSVVRHKFRSYETNWKASIYVALPAQIWLHNKNIFVSCKYPLNDKLFNR
jgi:hypothetical protein